MDKFKWNSKNTQFQKRKKGEIMEQGKKKGQIKNKYQDGGVNCNYIRHSM